MKITRACIIAGSVVGALAFAGCSSSSTSNSSSATTTSSGGSAGSSSASDVTCTSLSETFVQSLLGGPTEPPEPVSNPITGCSWYLDTNDLSVQGITVLNTAIYVFDGGKRAQSNAQVQDSFTYDNVSGLGDGAYYQTPKSEDERALTAGTILLVKNGSKAYNISVRKKGASVDDVKALEKQVAQELLKG